MLRGAPLGRLLGINNWLRCFSSDGIDVFERDVKTAHRERAAFLAQKSGHSGQDPLTTTVADRLLDRLDDCNRQFPTVAIIGGAGREVAQRLRSNTKAAVQKVVHIDASAAMLDAAKVDASRLGLPGFQTEYQLMRGEILPVEPESVDLVVSCLGLHWVNDLPSMMLQFRLALKPDGLVLAALWGGETLQELRIAAALAQQEREGGVSAVVSPLVQVRDAGNLLTGAGLALPTVDTDSFEMRYPSPAALIDHLRMMGETNAVSTRRRVMRRATAVSMMALYQSMFGAEDGSVPATFQAMFLAGWAPHESQQQPAARGSATVSFEDLASQLGKQGAVTGNSDGAGSHSGSRDSPPSSPGGRS